MKQRTFMLQLQGLLPGKTYRRVSFLAFFLFGPLLTPLQAQIAGAGERLFGTYGSHWHHCQHYEFENHPTLDLYSEVIDTFSDSEFAYSLIATEYLPYFFHSSEIQADTVLIANRGNQVYLERDDSLHLLYDFDVETGDTIYRKLHNEMDSLWFKWVADSTTNREIRMLIDSVGTVLIDGEELKRVYFSLVNPLGDNGYDWIPFFTGTEKWYTEKIGYNSYLFPVIFDGNDRNVGCDIRMFYDEQLTYDNENAFCISAAEEVSEKNFTLYPNPGNSVLRIKTTHDIVKMQIVDLYGRMLGEYENTTEIAVSSLPPGLYHLRVLTSENKIATRTFIVQ